MNRQSSILISPLLTALFFMSSCSTDSFTGRRQFNIMPDSVMNSMAAGEYKTFVENNQLSKDTKKTAMVKRVGERISNALTDYCEQNGLQESLEGFEWEFNLVEDPNINAWCMPGGKVVVYTGLLPVAQNEDGLAVVMGHEIAHAYANHGGARMSTAIMVQMGGMALDVALREKPEETRALFLGAYGMGSQVGVILPFSREDEKHADELGLIFMAMAGYNIDEAIPFWQRMSAGSEGQAPPEFLSTHPSGDTRIQLIRDEYLPKARQYYRPAK